MKRFLYPVYLLMFLGGCASLAPPEEPREASPPSQPSPPPSRGGYYKDDGPGDQPPPNLAEIPDAEPRREPLQRGANRPYQVFGKEYVPLAALQPFRQRGVASWYGRRFHGQKTASGERYDMYAMSAAHPTLPIPSYVRVTNIANGRSVVVRVNDRGPFHSERVIDLSYAAAYKLGFAGAGSAQVEIESIMPDETTVAAAPSTTAPSATVRSAAEQSTTVPSSTADSKAVYLQLGAFSSRENAEDFRSRIARQLAWLSEAVQVFATGSLWRLHVGPYRSNDAARSVAERIEAELNLRPLLVVR